MIFLFWITEQMSILKKIVFKHWFLLDLERNKQQRYQEKNTNIAFSRTELGKRFEVIAAFFSHLTQITGGEKGLLIYCCLKDSLLSPRQAGFKDFFFFCCVVLVNVINIIQILSLLSLFIAFFFPQKWNAKFCHLGVDTIITAADIANGKNRTGSRKMWPKAQDFSSSCDIECSHRGRELSPLTKHPLICHLVKKSLVEGKGDNCGRAWLLCINLMIENW